MTDDTEDRIEFKEWGGESDPVLLMRTRLRWMTAIVMGTISGLVVLAVRDIQRARQLADLASRPAQIDRVTREVAHERLDAPVVVHQAQPVAQPAAPIVIREPVKMKDGPSKADVAALASSLDSIRAELDALSTLVETHSKLLVEADQNVKAVLVEAGRNTRTAFLTADRNMKQVLATADANLRTTLADLKNRLFLLEDEWDKAKREAAWNRIRMH